MRSKLTRRDLEIARWLGRHRIATAEQVMRRFEMQRSKVYQRLGALVDHGLVTHELGVRSARVYLATPKGLAATELDLPRGGVSPATAAHDLAVVDAAIPLEGSSTRLVLTEREIRRADRGGSKQFRIAARGTTGAADERGMWPDLVIVDLLTSGLHAIEVELSLKKLERIADKLRAYSSSAYETITYQCATAGIDRAVVQAGAQAWLGDRLRVVRIGSASDREECDDIERLLVAMRNERDRAESAERRASDAARLLDEERQAAFAIVDDIARYLRADRAEQRATRERWQLMTDRFAHRPSETGRTRLGQS